MKSFKFTLTGLPIGSKNLIGINDERTAAMSAAILSISERYSMQYICGELKRVLIEAGDEVIMLTREGDHGKLSIIEIDKEKGIIYL
jgi:predicted regulator of Ras-like GTPase activity (Roadblock/LC7/MglB family)